MNAGFDLVVVGGGPAGLAAATTAAQAGARVAVVDQQAEPGGQIYRAAERRARAWPHDLEVAHGAALVERARAAGMHWFGGRSVWQVTAAREVLMSDGERVERLATRHLLVATGALERAMPIPGWTLPGVMTAGAGQILLKSARTVPHGDVWLAGSGPLVLLLAAQWVRAGVRLAGVLDTTPWRHAARAWRHLPGALTGAAELARGWRWWREIRRAGVPWIRGVEAISAEGQGRLQRVRFTRGGREHSAAASGLFLHQGVVPNARLAQSMGVTLRWDAGQRAYAPAVDAWGVTSLPWVAVAGDGAGIVGAAGAERQGHLAGLQVAHALGRLDARARDARARPLRRELATQAPLRALLDAAFEPAPALRAPRDPSVVVCRCECVTVGAIRQSLANGCATPGDVKLATRCGMGPCQGRQCADTLQELVAERHGRPPDAASQLRVRSPVEPVSMGEWAALADLAHTRAPSEPSAR